MLNKDLLYEIIEYVDLVTYTKITMIEFDMLTNSFIKHICNINNKDLMEYIDQLFDTNDVNMFKFINCICNISKHGISIRQKIYKIFNFYTYKFYDIKHNKILYFLDTNRNTMNYNLNKILCFDTLYYAYCKNLLLGNCILGKFIKNYYNRDVDENENLTTNFIEKIITNFINDKNLESIITCFMVNMHRYIIIYAGSRIFWFSYLKEFDTIINYNLNVVELCKNSTNLKILTNINNIYTSPIFISNAGLEYFNHKISIIELLANL